MALGEVATARRIARPDVGHRIEATHEGSGAMWFVWVPDGGYHHVADRNVVEVPCAVHPQGVLWEPRRTEGYLELHASGAGALGSVYTGDLAHHLGTARPDDPVVRGPVDGDRFWVGLEACDSDAGTYTVRYGARAPEANGTVSALGGLVALVLVVGVTVLVVRHVRGPRRVPRHDELER